MDRRGRATTPPRERRQPALAVVTPKRKRTARGSPRQEQAANRDGPRPAVGPVRRTSARRRQIPAPPPAADSDCDNSSLVLLAHIAVAEADAAAEAAAAAAAAPAPAPAPACQNLRAASPPPLLPPAVDHQISSSMSIDHADAPPLPPVAVDHHNPSPMSINHGDAPPLAPMAVDHQNPSPMPMDHGDASANAGAEDCKKFPCPQGNAGGSKGDQLGGGVPFSPAAGAGASPMQLDNDVREELEPGEIAPKKPAAAGRNAGGSALGSILGKYKPPPVVVGRDGGRAAAEMSAAAMEKRRREVFVGGLSRDAAEEDVRAALSAAGEITQVRMFADRTTNKNKGYCFVAYRDAAMASRAVAELGDVKICGKQCRVAVPEGNEKTSKIAQRDPTVEDYYNNHMYEQRQAVHSSYITSWDPHAASYVVPPVVASQAGYYYPMYHSGNIMYLPTPDLSHGLAGPSGRNQMGQSGSGRPAGQPHRIRRN